MLEKYHFLIVMFDDESGDYTVPYCINKNKMPQHAFCTIYIVKIFRSDVKWNFNKSQQIFSHVVCPNLSY